MPDPNAFAGAIEGLAPPLQEIVARAGPPRFVEVTFREGPAGLLDMTDPRAMTWARLLDELARADQPAYVEIDPVSRRITNLLIPLQVDVGALTSTQTGDVEVELIIPHARHYLRRSRPDFGALLQLLQSAARDRLPVLVTETLDAHEIIDVRPNPRGLAPEALLSPSAAAAPTMAPVSLQQANQLFSLVGGQTCCPSTAAAPYI
jgi:hypothetical protein